MKAIVADPVGGPENLKLVDLSRPEPGDREVLVKVEASGVNFIDVYFREGLYPAPESPVRLGSEAAGVVVSSGQNSSFHSGQRVAFANVRGCYAEYAVVPDEKIVTVPESVSLDQAAAVLLQGMTAHYLTRSTFKLEPGQTCLVHAAAGGAGLLIVQMAKMAGATVIGTVSNPEKAKLALEYGADHVVVYTEVDFVAEVRRITNDKGVDVVYDSVGKETFRKSLDCLRARGMMVSFGQSSGAVGDIDPLLLSQKGSVFLTRPSLTNYSSDPDELRWRSREVFGWIQAGRLRVRIHKEYPLAEAPSAHRDLQGRMTSGKLLLKP